MQHHESRVTAVKEFKRLMTVVVVVGIVTTAGALIYIGRDGPIPIHVAIATSLGVFISMVLGCGLFAAAFFSSKSGHDDVATIKSSKERNDSNDR